MFSLIIPTYNSENRIIEFLDHIYPQLTNNDEIVVVNDGSKDNTLNILNEYIKDKKNILVFSIDNSGAGIARNIGIEKASKKYIWFVDDDDYIVDNALVNIKKEIKLTNPELFIFNVIQVNKNKKQKFWQFSNTDTYYEDISMIPSLYLKQQWVWNKIIKRSFLIDNNIKFDNEHRYFEDIYFFMQVYPIVKGIYFSTNVYYHYIKNDSSATASLANFKTYPNALWYEFRMYLKHRK